MTNEHKRKITFWVTPWLWENFYKLFPEHGARSAFLRDAVTEAIKLGPQSTVAKRVMEKIEKDETLSQNNR